MIEADGQIPSGRPIGHFPPPLYCYKHWTRIKASDDFLVAAIRTVGARVKYVIKGLAAGKRVVRRGKPMQG